MIHGRSVEGEEESRHAIAHEAPLTIESFDPKSQATIRLGTGGAPATIQYIAISKALGMHPNSGVQRMLREIDYNGIFSCVNFDGSSLYLGSRGLLPLLEIFVSAPSLTHINLASTGIGDEACSALCHAMRARPALKVLDLRNNRITQSAAPLLKNFAAHTGCSIKLEGNKDLFENSRSIIREHSLSVGADFLVTKPQGNVSDAPQPTNSMRSSFDTALTLTRRRLDHRSELWTAATRIKREEDAWLTLGLHVALPYKTFTAEAVRLQQHVVPSLNRRLRQYKVHVVLSLLFAPPRLAATEDFLRRAPSTDDDSPVALNARVRHELATTAGDIFLFFASPSKYAAEVAVDWMATGASIGPRAPLRFVYKRTRVHGVPESLRELFEDLGTDSTLPEQARLRRDLSTLPASRRFEYTASFEGLTHCGSPILALPDELVSTIRCDVFSAALALAGRAVASTPQRPLFAPVDDASAQAGDHPPLLRCLSSEMLRSEKRIVVLSGPPGSGKSAQIKQAFFDARQDLATCVAVYHAVLDGPRTMDHVLFTLLQQLGVNDSMRDRYATQDEIIDAFEAALKRYTAPTSALAVLLFVDDGDLAGSKGGLYALSNRDEKRPMTTANDVPVRILFSATEYSGSHTAATRLFVERLRIPPLTEEDAVTVLIHIMKARNYVRGPQSEDSARAAGVHIVIHKTDGCRPLYMSLAADALSHYNGEDVTMLTIADALPSTLTELVAHLATTVPEKQMNVLSHISVTLSICPETAPYSWLAAALTATRNPHDVRGGPVSERHGVWHSWARLIDRHWAPLVELDIAATRLLLPSFFPSPPRGWTAPSLWRAPVALGSVTVESAVMTAFEWLPASRQGTPRSNEATAASSTCLPGASLEWRDRTARVKQGLEALLARQRYIAYHRMNPIALKNIDPHSFAAAAGPLLVYSFTSQSLERELRRAVARSNEASVTTAGRLDSPLASMLLVLRRHWRTVTEYPASVFTALFDFSPEGNGHRPLPEDEKLTPPSAFDSQVEALYARYPASRLKPVSVCSVACGRDPHAVPFPEAAASPLHVTASSIAIFAYIGDDPRYRAPRGSTDAADRQSRMRYDGYLGVGQITAMAPPTFFASAATHAVITTHPTPIKRVLCTESEDCTAVRLAVSALQRSEVVVLSCYIVKGCMTLTKVAICSASGILLGPSVFDISGAVPVSSSSLDTNTLTALQWAPSTAVAAGNAVLIWPSAPRGADDVLNQRRDESTTFTGLSSPAAHISFSPGGAKVCAMDTGGTLVVWGSLDSPCPSLLLATTRVDGTIQRLFFATWDDVMFIATQEVSVWNSTTSRVRSVITVDRPFDGRYAVTWLPCAAKAPEPPNERSVLGRPRMVLTLVDPNGVASSYVEREAEAAYFDLLPSRTSLMTSPLSVADCSPGIDFAVSPTVAVSVDRARNMIHLCSVKREGVFGQRDTVLAVPHFAPHCLASGHDDQPSEPLPPAADLDAVQAAVTSICATTCLGIDVVVAGFRRRYPSAAVATPEDQSPPPAASDAWFEETTLLAAYTVARPDAAAPLPIPDLVAL